MKEKLVIGVTSPSMFSPQIQRMVEKVFNAIPVILVQNSPEDLTFLLKQVDAVILAGGSDICPTSFGKDITNGNELSKFDVPRDRREIFIVEYAKKHNLPILGICRGHQLLAYIHELPFVLNINGSDVCHNPLNENISMDGEPVHLVRVLKRFHKEFFQREMVNSFHHQAVSLEEFDYLKNGVEVIGSSIVNYNPEDEQNPAQIVELMRAKDGGWISCQWHPETDYEKNRASKIVLDHFRKMIAKKFEAPKADVPAPIVEGLMAEKVS